jgi:spore coat protein CotF
LIFAWLHERLQPTSITHIGINDQFIARLGVNVTESFHIALHQTEKAAVAILEDLFPNVRTVLGDKCLSLLREGYKIELEAIVSALGSASPLLSAAVD